MKKILLMVVVATMATVSARAQYGEEDFCRREIAVSYGGMSNSTWMSIGEALGTIIASFGQVAYDGGDFIGPIGAEYFYHDSPGIAYGAVGVFCRETKDMLVAKDKKGDCAINYITVMPAVKLDWFRRKNFGLYSKVAAGVCFRTRTEDTYISEPHHESKTDVRFNFQVSGIGIELGVPNFRAFAEGGFGEQGMLLAGLRCKF